MRWTPLEVKLEGDGAFEDWQAEPFAHGRLVRIAILEHGTEGGKPSIALGVETDDGERVIAETTWALLHAACVAFAARYGAPE